MLQAKLEEKPKHKIYAQYFFFENYVVYEIMWKNTVQPFRPQMKIWTHAHCMLDT